MSIIESGRLDWSVWVRGIFRAGISGGAAAVSSTFGVTLIDPADWNIHTGKIKLVGLICITFAASGVVSIMKFLQAQPIPDVKEVTTTVERTVKEKAPAATTVTTVTETHLEPLDKPPV